MLSIVQFFWLNFFRYMVYMKYVNFPSLDYFYLPSLILLSHPYPSMLGGSLVSSLFLLGLGIDVALRATLSYAWVFVAVCCPGLLELFVVELHSRVVWHHPRYRADLIRLLPFHSGRDFFRSSFSWCRLRGCKNSPTYSKRSSGSCIMQMYFIAHEKILE